MRRILRASAPLIAWLALAAQAQAAPSVVDPKLAVRTAVSGLVTRISMAFLGPNDMLVLEKQTGRASSTSSTETSSARRSISQ